MQLSEALTAAINRLTEQVNDVHTDMGKVLGALGRIQEQINAHDVAIRDISRRVVRLEGQRNRFNPTDSGMHYIRNNADGSQTVHDATDFEALIEAHELDRDGKTMRRIRAGGWKIALAVACFIAVAMTATLGAVLMQQQRPAVIVTPH